MLKQIKYYWDEMFMYIEYGVYGALFGIMRPLLRKTGGDFWLSCRHCGGSITPDIMIKHLRNHRDNPE